jgi:hypothetical protein
MLTMPPRHIRFSDEKVNQLLDTSGFKVLLVKKSGLYHYVIVASVPSQKFFDKVV